MKQGPVSLDTDPWQGLRHAKSRQGFAGSALAATTVAAPVASVAARVAVAEVAGFLAARLAPAGSSPG